MGDTLPIRTDQGFFPNYFITAATCFGNWLPLCFSWFCTYLQPGNPPAAVGMVVNGPRGEGWG